MPTLEQQTAFDQAITPETLKKHGGEVKGTPAKDAEEVTLVFPNMDSAASWARTHDLSDYTWFSKAWAAFGSAVEVDVMRPHPED